jgi:MFS family permease
LLLISGLGGLLAGVDFGIIGSALEFLNRTIRVSEAQLSFIVAIYTGGGVLASLFAGLCADWFGRKRLMIAGGIAFVGSILLIYTSQGFGPLLVGRVLMGLSGGIICVLVPLFMAECLPSGIRGRGTAIFQFMLTLGMVAAGGIGVFFTNRNAAVIEAAQRAFAADPAGLKAAVLAANNAAWRNMFLVAALPGLVYSLGACFVKESPRWLFRRGRTAEAEAVLRLSREEGQCALELAEMGQQHGAGTGSGAKDSLLQRKYVVPFALACIVLAATQATGINSIIAYAVVILRQAGLDGVSASLGYTAIMTLNCVMTLVGAALVDRAGRKVLLKVGTLGIIVTLSATALVYRSFEGRRVDVDVPVQALVLDNRLDLNVTRLALPAPAGVPMQLSILCQYGEKQRVVRAFMPTPAALRILEAGEGILAGLVPEDRRLLEGAAALKARELDGLDGHERELLFGARRVLEALPREARRTLAAADAARASQVVSVAPDPKDVDAAGKPWPLRVVRAKWGPIPEPATGWAITGLLCLFVSFFAVGPGVCVWLALTELMPTRIRSVGMGVAMVLNNGVQFIIALAFLPVVGKYGFSAMFFFWAACTGIYFATAAFFLPETKGRTLEEIEAQFETRARS